MKKVTLIIAALILSTSAFAKDKDPVSVGTPFENVTTTLNVNPNDGGQLPGCGPSGGQPNKCDPVTPPVPVPGALLLMLTGLVGLIGISRRKNRS